MQTLQALDMSVNQARNNRVVMWKSKYQYPIKLSVNGAPLFLPVYMPSSRVRDHTNADLSMSLITSLIFLQVISCHSIQFGG